MLKTADQIAYKVLLKLAGPQQSTNYWTAAQTAPAQQPQSGQSRQQTWSPKARPVQQAQPQSVPPKLPAAIASQQFSQGLLRGADQMGFGPNSSLADGATFALGMAVPLEGAPTLAGKALGALKSTANTGTDFLESLSKSLPKAQKQVLKRNPTLTGPTDVGASNHDLMRQRILRAEGRPNYLGDLFPDSTATQASLRAPKELPRNIAPPNPSAARDMGRAAAGASAGLAAGTTGLVGAAASDSRPAEQAQQISNDYMPAQLQRVAEPTAIPEAIPAAMEVPMDVPTSRAARGLLRSRAQYGTPEPVPSYQDRVRRGMTLRGPVNR